MTGEALNNSWVSDSAQLWKLNLHYTTGLIMWHLLECVVKYTEESEKRGKPQADNHLMDQMIPYPGKRYSSVLWIYFF